jgi:hypothetical protein
MSCNYEGLEIPPPKGKQVKADWTTKISPCVNTNHQPSQYIYIGEEVPMAVLQVPFDFSKSLV